MSLFSIPLKHFEIKEDLDINGSVLFEITPPGHCKSEKSVTLKVGPFRWVKFSPIFESNLAPLNQGQYSPIT